MPQGAGAREPAREPGGARVRAGYAAHGGRLSRGVGAVRFDAHANHAVNEVIERKLPLANLYRYQPQVPLPEKDAQEIAARIQAAIDREPSAYDSHPAPRQRFALVHALGAAGAGTVAVDDVEAWSLFADREALERRLTDEVRRNVAASSGHTIDAAAAA